MKIALRRCFVAILLLISAIALAKGKPEPAITTMWPDSSNPTLKLVFGKFVQQAVSYGGQTSFASDVLVQNVSAKRIPRASVTVRLFDRDKVRVGESVLNITDLGPSETTKIAFQFFTTGMPASISLAAHNDTSGVPTSLRTIPLKIVSVPAGAKLKVDGLDAGTTPRVVDLLVGTHILEFSKDGYATGSTPVDVAPDEAPGGSVTFELGGLSRDTVELRDGTSVLGDVISVSMTSVVLRIAGEDRTYDRNKVKKITLVERIVEQPSATSTMPASK
jgi:PEGA domain